MEHKLILGGNEFLPFARNCVTKLKKLGLSHASQAYEVGGVSIKIRIEPGHEYIRIEGGGKAYMESGQLEWTFPGLMNPTRLDPAKWNFLDIAPKAKYLGMVEMSSTKPGKQNNKLDLYEGMNSKAIGYPFKEYPADASAEQIAEVDELNSKTKDDFAVKTVARKVAVGYFPASLFSGKLRLFVQAQWGAPATLESHGLEVRLLGTSAILMYRGKDTESAVQLGVYSHLSAGLFTDEYGGYWLIHIHNPTHLSYKVKAYKLILSSVAKRSVKKLKSPKLDAEEKRKLEAYILSDAIIDTDNPVEVGEFPGRLENALAYGWKFNTSGSEASVVVHQGIGTDNHDNSWVARTLRLNISYVKDEAGTGTFTATMDTTPHGEWTDGWGGYNIFAPADDPPTMGILELKSLATNRPGVKPSFPFSDVSVYGYYKDDVWVPVKMSRTPMVEPWPKLKWSSKGITYPVEFPQDTGSNPYQFGYCPAGSSCSYEHHNISDGAYMVVSVGDNVTTGVSEFGTHTYFTRTVSGGGSRPNPVAFTGPTTTPFDVLAPAPEGFDYTGAENVLNISTANVTLKLQTYQGIHDLVWTLIIPTSDCEAVCVATWEYESDTLATITTTGTGVTGFSGTTVDTVDEKGMSYSFEPWAKANAIGGWYGFDTGEVVSSAPEPKPPASERIYYSNTAVLGAEGTPSGSYYRLFVVDRNYPFYDAGMYSFTSAGKRYEMSEGLKSPASVNYQHRFVGWA